jgi:hypothetical protein
MPADPLLPASAGGRPPASARRDRLDSSHLGRPEAAALQRDQPVQQDEEHHKGQHDAQHRAAETVEGAQAGDEAVDAGGDQVRHQEADHGEDDDHDQTHQRSPAGARGEAGSRPRMAKADRDTGDEEGPNDQRPEESLDEAVQKGQHEDDHAGDVDVAHGAKS